jgi:hypothetical protein
MSRALLLLALLAGCGTGTLRENLLPPAEREIVAGAETVRAFRLADGPISPGGRKRIEWQDWPTSGPSLVVDAALARELSRILSDPRSFAPGPARPSIPRPGVKFRFTKGLQEVVAMLCFDSRGATFYGSGQQANFDPSAAELTVLVKKLFPDDPVVQALK